MSIFAFHEAASVTCMLQVRTAFDCGEHGEPAWSLHGEPEKHAQRGYTCFDFVHLLRYEQD